MHAGSHRALTSMVHYGSACVWMRAGSHQMPTCVLSYASSCAQQEDCGPPPLSESDAADCPAPDEAPDSPALEQQSPPAPSQGAQVRAHGLGALVSQENSSEHLSAATVLGHTEGRVRFVSLLP